MVIYDLCCEFEHEFEGWFKNNDEFIEQQRSGLLTCPYCDSGVVHKKLSAPKVARKSNTVSQTSKAKDNVSNDKSVTDKSLVVGTAAGRVINATPRPAAGNDGENTFDQVGDGSPERTRVPAIKNK